MTNRNWQKIAVFYNHTWFSFPFSAWFASSVLFLRSMAPWPGWAWAWGWGSPSPYLLSENQMFVWIHKDTLHFLYLLELDHSCCIVSVLSPHVSVDGSMFPWPRVWLTGLEMAPQPSACSSAGAAPGSPDTRDTGGKIRHQSGHGAGDNTEARGTLSAYYIQLWGRLWAQNFKVKS